MTGGSDPDRLNAARDSPSPRRLLAELPTAVIGLLVVWIVVVGVLGLRLAIEVLTGPRPIYIWPDIATNQALLSAVLVYVVCLAAATLTRWRRPAASLPVTLATGVGIVIASAVATGQASALAFVLVGGVLSTLIGWLLLCRLLHAGIPLVAWAPLAMALGLGVIGMLFFGLGSFGILTTPTVLFGLAMLISALLAMRRPRPNLQRMRSWQPQLLSWFETTVVALTVGLVSFASLVTLAPETISDAVWLHLPIAREIWQTGAVSAFAHLESSGDPIQAHVLYAVAYGLGGLASTAILHALVGLGAITGVAGLGLLLGGRGAAIMSAAVFASMPLTLWLIGHALIDFFTVLFAITALICLVLWQRYGDTRWPMVAGALTGVGLATKLNMLPLIAVTGAALLLVGRQTGQWRERILACAAFGFGTLVALPWILRSVLENGTLSPKIQVVINALAARLGWAGGTIESSGATPVAGAMQVYDPQAFALGQSPLALLRIPWFLTFHADEHRFLVIGRGEIGILLLMLLPLVVFIPRSRGSALVGLTAVLSYVAWVFTPFQIIRHLLPTFALAAVLVGAAASNVLDRYSNSARCAPGIVVRGGLLLGLAVAPVFYLFGVLTQIPVDFLLGRESAVAYVDRSVPAAAALSAASALPADTPVAYFGRRDGGAQIYSEARLVYVEPNNTLTSLGTSPGEVLASLAKLGVKYFIWNRPATTTDDWEATVLSFPFLQDNTRIIAGDRNAYLFEILPARTTTWTERPNRNLLKDPDLKNVKRENGPWDTTGNVKGARGIPSIRSSSLIAQRVPILGDKAYLLVVRASCPDAVGSVDLALHWFDKDNQDVGRGVEAVVPGTTGSEQILWHRAPAAATSVSVELTTSRRSSACAFDTAALYTQT